MGIIGLIFGLFLGSMTIEQVHYTECKKLEFKSDACKIEKHLSTLSDKK